MILITGATGNNGAEIVRGLLKKHNGVRAMVRKIPAGKNSLPTGVEPVAGDFDNEDSLRNALKDVDHAFLVTPSSDRVEEQQLRFIDVAREAGVRHVVYLSQLHAKADSPVRFLRYHATVEDALRRSGMDFTNLRPNLYMQGLLMFKRSIMAQGQFSAPLGDARVSIVDVRDIAAVAVAALTGLGHAGKTYDITGPEALTHAEMADALSDALGRTITFADVHPPVFLKALLSFHMPAWQAEGLAEDYAHYSRGEASGVSSAVEEVTGRPPRDFHSFVQEYRKAFLLID